MAGAEGGAEMNDAAIPSAHVPRRYNASAANGPNRMAPRAVPRIGHERERAHGRSASSRARNRRARRRDRRSIEQRHPDAIFETGGEEGAASQFGQQIVPALATTDAACGQVAGIRVRIRPRCRNDVEEPASAWIETLQLIEFRCLLKQIGRRRGVARSRFDISHWKDREAQAGARPGGT